VYHLPAGTYSLPDDAGKLAQELLVALGLIDRSAPPPPPTAPPAPAPPPTTDAPTDAAKARTRTVSKKMKDAFLASPGASDDSLKRVIKAYKDASDADIAAAGGDFATFANHVLAAPAPAPQPAPAPATPPPPAKKDSSKKAKTKPRLAWSAAEKKVFKEIVADPTDDLKADFEAYVASKSDEDFGAFSMAGHMRAWFVAARASAETEAEPKAGNGEFTPAEYDLARSMQKLNVSEDAEEEEDLIDIEINEEHLLIGSKTGDIFQPCELGDIKLGTAGQGKYKDVTIPAE
jgi:hypothetical protein